jgi:8-oxo-dGTP pyrophosphatase MutT (NUDIX family)
MNKKGNNSIAEKLRAPIRLGVYGICIQEEKILMVKTLAGDKYIYNFPGGGIEAHESLADCLFRECKEELGCEIYIDKLAGTSSKLFESIFFNSQKFNIYYLIKPNGPINGALEGATWFRLDQLPYDMMLDCDKEFIGNFIKQLML